mmetsp:Transcript_3785/g.8946  ORF Transcript_3785/g.8946 Transcript_3785/m.8946 type:complete len:208 (+) Transcript_3785:595-1218(+)
MPRLSSPLLAAPSASSSSSSSSSTVAASSAPKQLPEARAGRSVVASRSKVAARGHKGASWTNTASPLASPSDSASSIASVDSASPPAVTTAPLLPGWSPVLTIPPPLLLLLLSSPKDSSKSPSLSSSPSSLGVCAAMFTSSEQNPWLTRVLKARAMPSRRSSMETPPRRWSSATSSGGGRLNPKNLSANSSSGSIDVTPLWMYAVIV